MAQHTPFSTPRASNLAQLEDNLVENLLSPFTPTPKSRNQIHPDPVEAIPLTPQFDGPKLPLDLALKQERFLAIAARAYQEAVKLPETPPPTVWAPNDKMHSYYEWLLYRFGAELRSNLQRQGVFDYLTFRNEWLRHSRSITDNIRAEWGLHPLGSIAGIRTTLKN
ncbi:predicted protein [Uncinocarpus reesii 1704]|uniref:Uncharacterized protein n=1 Tax=Uncinocarpus reesii (strain UAMH 1704) TaxID=336963 RepID=C4K058_UNCRE|nr:uncharacterized protein UREG_07809 [Uncinocarpus reesii 1704]EEP82944.1 predicted protein [Uncinocarpus reesii 1704]